jgi:AcrR family transcriptional regulator
MAQRKEAHRTKLLRTAVRLFGKHGYHATTVPMIVKESGSSTGSFYFYFRNKEDLFAVALESFGKRLGGALKAAAAAAGDDPLLRMEAALTRLALLMALNPDEARIFIVESSGLSPRLEQIRRNIVDGHARSVELDLQGLASVLPPLDSEVIARCWVGALYESMVHWLRQPANHRRPTRVVAESISAFNLRGIGAPVKSRPDSKG